MKTNYLLILCTLFLFPITTLRSHPGVGIVIDRRGNVYYTDLKHVWKLAPDGTKSIAVRNVHTHELVVDSLGNVYGEHLWYEGEATDRWGHRVWKLSPDGKIADIIPSRRGFLDDYDDFHFARDGAGASYWVDRAETTVVRRRRSDGTVQALASAPFKNVRWMTATRTGTVYLVDLHDLVCITPDGNVTTVVRDLADKRRSIFGTVDDHAIMGLWTDSANNVYAAVSSDKAVKRVSIDGRVEVIYRSRGAWAPSGGCVDAEGNLWVLEYAAPYSVHVVKVDRKGSRTAY